MDYNGFSMDDLEPRPIVNNNSHVQGGGYSQQEQQQQPQQMMMTRPQQQQSPMYTPNFQQSFDQQQYLQQQQQIQYPQQEDTFPQAPSFQQQTSIGMPASMASPVISHQFHGEQQQNFQQASDMNNYQGSCGGSVSGSVGGGSSVGGSRVMSPAFQQQQQQQRNGFSSPTNFQQQQQQMIQQQQMQQRQQQMQQHQQQMQQQQQQQQVQQQQQMQNQDQIGPDDFMHPTDFSSKSASLDNTSEREKHFYQPDRPSNDFYEGRQKQKYQATPRRPEPVDPLPDQTAQYARCVTEPSISIINQAMGGKPTPRRVEVMRANDNTCHAYAIDKHTPALDIINDGIRRGKIFRGVVYRRIAPLSNFFETPSRDKALFVTIKRYGIEAMRDYLMDESSPIAKENPDVEIERLQTIGDNKHIVGKCDKLMTDALVNDRYVYIIHPYTGHDTLTHRIARIHPNSDGDIDLPMPRILPDILEENARSLFRQLLTSVHYMNATHGVCHCDLSTDHGYLKGAGDTEKILVFGLNRSVRAPPSAWHANVLNATPVRNYGGSTESRPFWAPEVWMSRIQDADGNDPTWERRGFSPPARDLWAAVLMLFRYVTGELLYELPDPVDPTYRYFVLSQGLSPTSPLHEELLEQWNELQEDLAMEHAGAGFVMRRIDVLHHKLQLLSPELLELFDNSFRVSPLERWTLMDVVKCRWMNMDVGGTPMDQQSERSSVSHATHTTHNTHNTHNTHATQVTHATQTTHATQQSYQQPLRTYSIDPF